MNLSKTFAERLVLVRQTSTYSAQVLLSNANKQKCMKRYQGMKIKQDSSKATRRAAVLIPICVKDNKVSLLYTLRAADLKSHRGQVSFPGGMYDDCDITLEQTALRETQEELGINPMDIEVWGRGRSIARRDLNILPIVGCLKTDISPDTIKLNVNEVEDVFTISIEDLCNPKLWRHTQFRDFYSAPAYCAGAYRVWGLTAIITHIFLRALLPKNTYKQKLTYIPNVKAIISSKL